MCDTYDHEPKDCYKAKKALRYFKEEQEQMKNKYPDIKDLTNVVKELEYLVNGSFFDEVSTHPTN